MRRNVIAKAFLALGFLTIAAAANAQPVSDRAVVPVAVTLNQILRLNVTNGGNIEFVFNRIDQYENGIANSAMYDTDIDVSSSTRWELAIGAEDATFIGTDDPTNILFTLDNVGYQIISNGAHAFGTELTDPANANAGVVALTAFSTTVIGSASALAGGNSGDRDDNNFTINWECGTTNGTMNATALIDQDLAPDRYVTNVLMDLVIAP